MRGLLAPLEHPHPCPNKYVYQWWWRQVDWWCPGGEPQLLIDTSSLSHLLGFHAAALNFKLLPSSLLEQTDRYLLMNPHAPVTLAPSGPWGEHPLLLSSLVMHWIVGKVEEVGSKVKGGGHRGVSCGCMHRGHLGLMDWITAKKCNNGECHCGSQTFSDTEQRREMKHFTYERTRVQDIYMWL